MGSWKGRGNQYIEFPRVLYCKLPTNGKELPAFPHKALTGIEPRPQRWDARVLPLCHHGPYVIGRAIEVDKILSDNRLTNASASQVKCSVMPETKLI